MGHVPALKDIIVEASHWNRWNDDAMHELEAFIMQINGNVNIEYYIENKISYFYNKMDYIMWLYRDNEPQSIIKHIIEIEDNEKAIGKYMTERTKMLSNGVIIQCEY